MAEKKKWFFYLAQEGVCYIGPKECYYHLPLMWMKLWNHQPKYNEVLVYIEINAGKGEYDAPHLSYVLKFKDRTEELVSAIKNENLTCD